MLFLLYAINLFTDDALADRCITWKYNYLMIQKSLLLKNAP